MPTFTAEFLTTQAINILAALGTPPDLAELVARSLVGANLAGHDSHGVSLLPIYAEQIQAGHLKPAARASIAPATGMLATLAVDGALGWGPAAAFLATEQVINRAQQYGVSAAVIRRCQHIGRVGQYVERISAENLIGIATCNSGRSVVPFGGTGRYLGTNPIAIAAPRQAGRAPVMYDGSTSVVAGNKLRVWADKDRPVPGGWIVDAHGQPSTNASDYFNGGALLPLGGYKGYGLGVMVELLAGLLSGASAAFLPDFAVGNGVLIMAIRPDAFVPIDEYLAQVERVCDALISAPRADATQPILLPGEPEQLSRTERTAHGIPLTETTWQTLVALANSLEIDET